MKKLGLIQKRNVSGANYVNTKTKTKEDKIEGRKEREET